MSRRWVGPRRTPGRGNTVSQNLSLHPSLEPLEGRRLLSVAVQGETPEFRLIGITGNQQSDLTRYVDETLYDIKFASAGTDPIVLDGWTIPGDAAPGIAITTVDSIPGSVPLISDIAQGSGALRVSIPQNGSAYWALRSPNVVDLLAAKNAQGVAEVNTLTFDLNLIARELNGGSFSGTDDSYTGYAQSNALAISLSDGTWIQRTMAEAGQDDLGLEGQWSGQDGIRRVSWDLSAFTAPDGSKLHEYIAARGITEARIFVVAQGDEVTSPNANGTQGPARFYFDNFRLGRPRVSGGPDAKEHFIGDFDPLYTEQLVTLPFVPDTDSIAYNPANGLLYRASGASSYRNGANNINHPGYRDNHYMQTVDPNSPATQAGVFNANAEKWGLPAPFPTFLSPSTRRTDEQSDPSFGTQGPNEYHALRDFTWSDAEQVFYGASDDGIFRITPAGQVTKVGEPGVGGGGPKGITFATVEGERRLLVSSQEGSLLVTVNPADASVVGQPVVMFDARTQEVVNGMLTLVQAPDGVIYGIRNVRRPGSGGTDNLAFVRELVTVDPVSGEVRSIGALGRHIADLAIVPAATPVVSEVFVRGADWLGQDNNATTTNFMEYLEAKGLGDDNYGYRLFGTGHTPPAGNEHEILPWINMDQLVVKYNVAPTGAGVPTPTSLTVTGAKGNYTITSVTPVAGDPTAFVLTLNKPLGGGNPATGVAPTPDENGDVISLGVPAGGAGGSNFTLGMNVLQGDTDHLNEGNSHVVLARDFAEVKKKFFKTTTDAPAGNDTDYNPFFDVDGSGNILARDYAEVKKRFFQALSIPVVAANRGTPTGITSLMFGSEKILG